MSSSALLFALLAPHTAHAAACCTGNTSTAPTVVGECERAAIGFTAGAETAVARWDDRGQVVAATLDDDALIGTLAAGLRLHRRWQVGGSLPTRVQHKGSDTLDAWGAGVGDARLGLLWDPQEELGDGPPVPLVGLGARLPTGRAWDASQGVMMEDVTGLPGAALSASVGVERSLDPWPWSVALTGELGVSGPTKDAGATASASLGRYLSSRASLAATLAHTRARADLAAAGTGTARTTAGLRLVTGRPLRWRAWAAVGGDLPAPYLGKESVAQLRGEVGAVLVR
jgi:hypothetical protein